jgi:S1-C subfamily serine protease
MVRTERNGKKEQNEELLFEDIKNNGYYMETIKTRKKSFVSRILLPLFVCILCITLSVCATALTVFYVRKINQPDTDLLFLSNPTDPPEPVNTDIPVPAETQEADTDIEPESEKRENLVITTYRDISRVEVTPLEVDSNISDAVQKIMPSIAYIKCMYANEKGVHMNEASALIISNDGYMITADSVIEPLCYDKSNKFKENCSITVFVDFDFNTLYFAKVIGRDKTNNVALLKIDCDRPLQFIEYGDSDKLYLGETVVAVASGNNAFKGQVSAGIVTGLSYTFNDRILSDAETPKDLMHMINTSTVMTGSNNGGALVNKKGQVVALTVFIKDEQQNGFFKAIPINKVKEASENLEVKSYNEETTPNLGIGISAEAWNFSITSEEDQKTIYVKGIRVSYVGYGTPAFYSGLRVGDMIISINDVYVNSAENFIELKNTYLPGESLELTVYRRNETGDLKKLIITVTQDTVK